MWQRTDVREILEATSSLLGLPIAADPLLSSGIARLVSIAYGPCQSSSALSRMASRGRPNWGVHQLRAGFQHLYRATQRELFARDGISGPLRFYDHGTMQLFVSSCSKRLVSVYLPDWDLWRKATWLYDAVRAIPTYLYGRKAQYNAKQNIDYLVRRIHLPPVRIPPLRASAVLSESSRTIKAIARRSLARV